MTDKSANQLYRFCFVHVDTDKAEYMLTTTHSIKILNYVNHQYKSYICNILILVTYRPTEKYSHAT